MLHVPGAWWSSWHVIGESVLEEHEVISTTWVPGLALGLEAAQGGAGQGAPSTLSLTSTTRKEFVILSALSRREAVSAGLRGSGKGIPAT